MDNVTQSNSNCSVDTSVESVLVPSMYMASFLVSIPGNCLSIYVACLHVKRDNEIGIYLLNLSVVDILYTLTLPYWFMEYIIVIPNKALYNVLIIVMYSAMYLSPAFLCCISMNRYLAIVHPLRFFGLRTVRATILASSVCWTIQLMFHALLLHRQNFFSTFASSLVYVEVYPMKSTLFVEYIARFSAGFCLPLTLLLFCSHRIFKAIEGSITTVKKEKKKIAKLLFQLILVYVISFGPYQIIMLVRSLVEPGNCNFAQKTYTFYKVAFALTGLNCAADPIIYCLLCESAKCDISNFFMRMKINLQRLYAKF
ncbi:G-protein coupled receptor 4-like [Scyliorhinus torazame]|uniref:G-protein coupled receptor 4-like n=1 Tax=Scyliorhinus torazame TaxID=75743 RepID=UPI003B5CE6D4